MGKGKPEKRKFKIGDLVEVEGYEGTYQIAAVSPYGQLAKYHIKLAYSKSNRLFEVSERFLRHANTD